MIVAMDIPLASEKPDKLLEWKELEDDSIEFSKGTGFQR